VYLPDLTVLSTSPPVLLFLHGAWTNDFDGGKSITRASGRVEFENLNFFGPKRRSLCLLPFQGPKKARFSEPTPSSGLRNGLASIKII
jgi:hypothetical protein